MASQESGGSLVDIYGNIGRGLDQCLGVRVEVPKEITDIDPLGVGLGFFFGILLGAIIGVLCGKLCIKDIARSKQEDEEAIYVAQKGLANHEKNRLIASDSPKKKSINKRNRRRRRLEEDEELLVPVATVSLAATVDHVPYSVNAPAAAEYNNETKEPLPSGKSFGMSNVFTQTNPEAMDAELAQQDIQAIEDLDKELREEGINTMVQMLRVMLGKELAKGNISEDEFKELVTRLQDNITGIVQKCQQDQAQEEEELTRKYSKNPDAFDNEKEKLYFKYINRMNSSLKDEKERLRSDLSKSTKMTDDQIDALLAEHTDNMALLEKKLGAERARMTATLEDRLARRKALVETQNAKQDQQKMEIEYRKDIQEKAMQSLVDEDKLMERQKKEILAQYENDLKNIQMKQEQHVHEQQVKLAEKLSQRRLQQERKLKEKQEREREDFLKQVDKASSAVDITMSYHELISQQRNVAEEMNDELDQMESEEFENLKKHYDGERYGYIENREAELMETLQSRCQLSEREAARLMRIHEAEMEEYERIRKVEKKRIHARLQEKLEQRRLRAEEEQAATAAEAVALKEQQDLTIKKVLDSQIELDDEARKRILKEHDQNTQAITNQLQMSKLRQQKVLEKKLAMRRAKVAELKQRKEHMEITSKSEGKENTKQSVDLQKMIDAEEARLEKERKDKLNELRQRINAETEEALKDQEKQIGLLIGRLQVGSARRQALIAKQNQTIKELEDQVANKLEGGIDEQDNSQVDHLLQQHQHQMANLNDKLQESKERQEQVLMERLQAKKLKKEREIDRTIEKEARDEEQEQRFQNTGLASSILGNLMLEQRHKARMNDLEKEMQMEMHQQREELNRELEEELQKELEEQKKSFLAQLAAISNVSKDEMNEIVENAVIDAGGNEKEAKKLSKEMRQELTRAKSELGEDYRSERRQSSYRREEDPRPKSSRRGSRPPSGYRQY